MAIQIQLPIRYANVLPARQDEAILLPARQHMNYHQCQQDIYQLAHLYRMTGFKSLATFFNIFELDLNG